MGGGGGQGRSIGVGASINGRRGVDGFIGGRGAAGRMCAKSAWNRSRPNGTYR